MTQADRIRQYTLYNYIEPARRVGHEYVEICAGDVNKAMVAKGLLPSNRVPNVCNALRGGPLRKLANVEFVCKTGPYAGTTATFRYRII